jgi:hypothetical protein
MRRGWKTVLTFISGMVFGELSSDFTDFIYFTYYKDVNSEFMAVLGGYLSWRALSSSASPAYLLFVLGIPTMVSLGILWGLKRRVE